MYNVSEELKTIYKNDFFPATQNIAPKELELKFLDIDLTVGTDQFAVDKGDFELHESICMEDQLKFGKCNVGSVKFTLADVTDDIKGKEFEITQTVNVDVETSYPMPLGYFTVDSAPKQDDLRFKDITAYDRMRRIDVDVSGWYNSLTFPMPLAAFRASFLAYIGLEEISRLPLPNDSIEVEKTINPSSLSGRTVIEACEEISGCFGHINRNGKFTHIFLSMDYGLYPAETLYPSEDLYPEYGAEILDQATYRSVTFEEYTVKPIDKLVIRRDDGDVGAVIGTGENAYTIQDNFLLYGKSAEDLQSIGNNIFNVIQGISYRPFSSQNIGLPYLEVGDPIGFEQNDYIVSFVLQRTLKGIQALTDEFEAQGSEEQKQYFGPSNEIIQLKNRSTKIEKSVDGLRVDVENMDERLSSEIDVLAGQVVVKVNSDGRIGYIALSADPNTDLTEFKVVADNIALEGLVTVNGNFKVNLDGTIEAVGGKFSGNITASEFVGGTVRSQNYSSGNTGMMIDLNYGTIDTPNFYLDTDGKIHATGGEFSGSIYGSDISGSRFISSGPYTSCEIDNGFIGLTSQNGYSYIYPEYIRMFIGNEKNIDISYTGSIRCKSLNINGETPITPNIFDMFLAANISNHVYPPASHPHYEYATTGYVGAVDASIRAWVSQAFEPKA